MFQLPTINSQGTCSFSRRGGNLYLLPHTSTCFVKSSNCWKLDFGFLSFVCLVSRWVENVKQISTAEVIGVTLSLAWFMMDSWHEKTRSNRIDRKIRLEPWKFRACCGCFFGGILLGDEILYPSIWWILGLNPWDCLFLKRKMDPNTNSTIHVGKWHANIPVWWILWAIYTWNRW